VDPGSVSIIQWSVNPITTCAADNFLSNETPD
jgi:hypothetical protein